MTDTIIRTVDYGRQADILNPELAMAAHVSVLGLGTVGSNVAVECARLGIGGLHLVDFDVIEAVNIPSQRYTLDDLGSTKAEACQKQVTAVSDHVKTTVSLDALEGGEFLPAGYVALSVDDMGARKEITEKSLKFNPSHPLVVDVRMGGASMQVYAFNPAEKFEVERYLGTIFPQSEAAELPCGGRSVATIGAMSGAYVGNLFRLHIMGQKVPWLSTFDGDILRLQTFFD